MKDLSGSWETIFRDLGKQELCVFVRIAKKLMISLMHFAFGRSTKISIKCRRNVDIPSTLDEHYFDTHRCNVEAMSKLCRYCIDIASISNVTAYGA